MLRHIVMKAVFVLLSFTNSDVMSGDEASALHAEPSYAKWGKLAMEETAKAYRDASIIDYKYEGRHAMGRDEAEESFLLWVKQGGREFGVRVTIKVEAAADKLKGVSLVEVK
jgi:hypothetical protein